MGFLKHKNMLITGANGFIGTAATEYFTSQGAHVIALVKDINRKTRLQAKGNVSIVRGDITDMECLKYCLSKYEVHYVLHLAAQPIVRICQNDPYTAYKTNIMGTLSLLEACRTLVKPVEKAIVMTSDKAYGPHEKLPYVEEAPLNIADSYCTSKACQDMLSMSYGRTYDMPIVVVRAGNIYGPGDLNTSRLIPRSILRLLAGEKPVLYSGVADYIREFVYIDNLLSAYSFLFESGKNGEAYNVGGTEPQRIGDVINMIRDKIDSNAEIEIVNKDFYELKEQYLCAKKIMELGWKPEVSLDEGLTRSIEWYVEYKNNRGWE